MSMNDINRYENLVSELMYDDTFNEAVKGQIEYLKEEGFETRQRPFSEDGTVAAKVVTARSTYGIDVDQRPDLQNKLDEISKLYDVIINSNTRGSLRKKKKRKSTKRRKAAKRRSIKRKSIKRKSTKRKLNKKTRRRRY